MTTIQTATSDEMAAALDLVYTFLAERGDFACRYVGEMRNAAQPGSGVGQPGSLPWQDRTRVASAMRAVAAERPEVAALLEPIADGLDASLRQRAVNS